MYTNDCIPCETQGTHVCNTGPQLEGPPSQLTQEPHLHLQVMLSMSPPSLIKPPETAEGA